MTTKNGRIPAPAIFDEKARWVPRSQYEKLERKFDRIVEELLADLRNAVRAKTELEETLALERAMRGSGSRPAVGTVGAVTRPEEQVQ